MEIKSASRCGQSTNKATLMKMKKRFKHGSYTKSQRLRREQNRRRKTCVKAKRT